MYPIFMSLHLPDSIDLMASVHHHMTLVLSGCFVKILRKGVVQCVPYQRDGVTRGKKVKISCLHLN